jgi:glycosyltransferase involved in cell wall biosynthesis
VPDSGLAVFYQFACGSAFIIGSSTRVAALFCIPENFELTELAQDRSRAGSGRAIFDRRPVVSLMTNSLDVGGSEKQFVALVEGLNRERVNVQPSCLRRTGGLVSRLPEIAEFRPGGSLYGWKSLRARMAIRNELRRTRSAVAHAFDFYTNLMLVPAAKFAGVPVVLAAHRQLGDLLSPAQFWAQLQVFRWCDRVVCNSSAAAGRLLREGISQRRIVVIPNGVSDHFYAANVPAFPRKPGVIRVGMIARMNHAVKNHDLFLQAAAEVERRVPQVEFLLVGDGPLRPALEAAAREWGIAEKVIFAGERHDIPAILASLDLSVLISSSESLSNAILESLAAGVPVVATAVGGNPELIRDGSNGMLVAAGERDALVNAITQLSRDENLRLSCSQQARESARSFRMDEICRRYEDLYRALLEEKGVKAGAAQ